MSSPEAADQHGAEGALRATPDGAETGFDRLAKAVDDYRKVRADDPADVGSGASPDPSRLADLRSAEQTVSDCIRALGWRSPTEAGAATATCPGHDPQAAFGVVDSQVVDSRVVDSQLVRATLALVDLLAVAECDSDALVERVTRAGDQSCPGLLHAALHCQGLVADALLTGAIELADTIGIPASRLPL